MNRVSLRTIRAGILVGLTLALGGVLPAPARAQNVPPEVLHYPEMIFYNGKVITADEKFSIFQAVAVRDGKFLAVGDSARIQAMAGPNTRKIDLNGRSIIPGMISTHEHGYVGNSSKAGVRIMKRTVPEIIVEMKAVVDKLPPGEHAYFSGPSIVQFMCHNDPAKFRQEDCVSLAQLDAIAPNRPLAIVLQNNQVVVNSEMLKLIGDMNLSGVLKDKNGKPTGQLRGGAGGVVVYEIMPWEKDWLTKSVAEERKNMAQWPPRGITTLMGRSQGQAITVLRELWIKGELNTRVRFAHEFLRQNPRPEMFLKRVGNLTDLGDDMFKIIGATSQAADGDPYTADFKRIKIQDNDSYGLTGNFKWSEAGDLAGSDRQNILLANRYGWSMTGYHTAGDAANDEMLKVFAEANKERPLAGRHWGMDHNEMLRKEHIPLFKEMGINANLRGGTFTGTNDSDLSQFGADAISEMGLVKTLINAGLRPVIEIGGGLEAIQGFMMRKTEDGRVWNPAESVSKQEALWMYTLWAAGYSGEQNKIGSIEPGKLADFVLLAADYMTWPAEDLASLAVQMTVVGGKVVFEAPGTF